MKYVKRDDELCAWTGCTNLRSPDAKRNRTLCKEHGALQRRLQAKLRMKNLRLRQRNAREKLHSPNLGPDWKPEVQAAERVRMALRLLKGYRID